jgi:uncharacterized protein involved in response to NO
LHALTIGYFSSMVIGMASRVSLGHSGRSSAADRLTWTCFWGVLATAGVRIAAELPLVAHLAWVLIPLAAAAWLASFAPWVVRYVPLYVKPNADEAAG